MSWSRDMPSRSVSMSQNLRQLPEILDHQVRLMRPVAERATPAVDEARAHAVRLRADAVEHVVRDEEDRVRGGAHELRGRAVGRDVRLERARLLHRQDAVELDA